MRTIKNEELNIIGNKHLHYKPDYKRNNYKSRYYPGDWLKIWTDEIAKKALQEKVGLFDEIGKFGKCKTEHLPIKLYKFFPYNKYSLECLIKDQVYINNPSNFNSITFISGINSSFSNRYC